MAFFRSSSPVAASLLLLLVCFSHGNGSVSAETKAHISKFIASAESVLLMCDDPNGPPPPANVNATAAYPTGDEIQLIEFRYCAFDAHPSDVLGHFHNLSAVYLTASNIAAINGSAFSGSPALSYVDLSYNQIEKVSPNDFVGLERLRHLSLQGNLIERVPAGAFEALGELDVLNLSLNFIREIDGALFNQTNRLIELNLSHNSIATLTATTLAHLSELTTLELAHSALESIEAGAFDATPKLTKLDVSHNLLKEIYSGWQPPELSVLLLDDNLLAELGAHILDGMPRLETLQIANNPFKCSVLREFIRLAMARTVAIDVSFVDVNESRCVSDADMLIAVTRQPSESAVGTTTTASVEQGGDMRSEGANGYLEIPLKEADEEPSVTSDEDNGALKRTIVVWIAFLVILVVLAIAAYIVFKKSKKEKEPELVNDTESPT